MINTSIRIQSSEIDNQFINIGVLSLRSTDWKSRAYLQLIVCQCVLVFSFVSSSPLSRSRSFTFAFCLRWLFPPSETQGQLVEARENKSGFPHFKVSRIYFCPWVSGLFQAQKRINLDYRRFCFALINFRVGLWEILFQSTTKAQGPPTRVASLGK